MKEVSLQWKERLEAMMADSWKVNAFPSILRCRGFVSKVTLILPYSTPHKSAPDFYSMATKNEKVG